MRTLRRLHGTQRLERVNRTDRTVVFQIGLTIAILVLIAIIIGWLAGGYAANSTEKIKGSITDTDFLVAEANSRILPVGHVITQSMVDANPELAKGAVEAEVVMVVRSGDEVVDYLCASCHTAGVGGAPKLDDAADWGARYAQGMDALMVVGIEGKAGTTMMPRGGDPSLSDDDIWNSIVAMLKRAGVTISETERTAEVAPTEEAATVVDEVIGAATENVETMVNTAAESVDAAIEKAGDTVKSMTTGAGDLIVDKVGEVVKPAVEAVTE